jgi:nucleotide-binding universal stress UspA family protein
MKAVKKILVPTDFSNDADLAVEFAFDLAEKFDSEVTFLHAYQLPTYVLPDGAILPAAEVVASVMTEAQDRLSALVGRAKEANVRATFELRQGVPLTEILGFAKQSLADLIVMGTHGRTGIEHFLIGSVAEKVVRKAPCPVLTVRPQRNRPVHASP